MAIAICVGGVLVFNNAITMGVLIAYISTIKKLIEPLSRCYQLVVRSQTALVSVSRVFEVIDIRPEKNVLTGASNYNDMADSPIISFKDVTFGYGQENVLVNVSFNVRKGERIAFCRRKRKWKKHDYKTHFKTNINGKGKNILSGNRLL